MVAKGHAGRLLEMFNRACNPVGDGLRAFTEVLFYQLLNNAIRDYASVSVSGNNRRRVELSQGFHHPRAREGALSLSKLYSGSIPTLFRFLPIP
jgi:hypothetical protein